MIYRHQLTLYPLALGSLGLSVTFAALVHELYGLTEEEISIVKGRGRG